MATVNVYLTFNGDCEAAFHFYHAVFGGEVAFFGRFRDMPQEEIDRAQFSSEEELDRIMHVTLPISEETRLMGSDTAGQMASDFQQGNNFSVSITAESKAEADRLFNGLSEGGQVIMPMSSTFWGDYFGMLVDKFGISWMVSFDMSGQAS